MFCENGCVRNGGLVWRIFEVRDDKTKIPVKREDGLGAIEGSLR